MAELDVSKWGALIDIPADTPALGYTAVARELANLIQRGTPRLSLALIGPWGSGKTTLMDAIRRHLRPAVDGSTTRLGGVVEVTFNAWRFDRDEVSIVALIESIRAGLAAWEDRCHPLAKRNTQDAIRKLGALSAGASEVIAKASTSKVSAALGVSPVKFSMEFTSTVNREGIAVGDQPRLVHDRLSAALQDVLWPLTHHPDAVARARIVVYIDDLDRCQPSKTLEVLGLLKMLFDIEGVIFVVGLDLEALNRAAIAARSVPALDSPDATWSDASGDLEQLIDKIFQVIYTMPDVDRTALRQLVATMCAPLPGDQLRHLVEDVTPHLEYLEGRVTPRRIKRFLNAYVVHMKIVDRPDRFREVLTVMLLQRNMAWRASESDEGGRELIRRMAAGEDVDDLPAGFKEYRLRLGRNVEWGAVDRVAWSMRHSGGERALLSDAAMLLRSVRQALDGEPGACWTRSTTDRRLSEDEQRLLSVWRRDAGRWMASLRHWLPQAIEQSCPGGGDQMARDVCAAIDRCHQALTAGETDGPGELRLGLERLTEALDQQP